jgi:hypothetical protein
MIYSCLIKNPKKIREFWIDRVEVASKELDLFLPDMFKMSTKEIQLYAQSLWAILGEEVD